MTKEQFEGQFRELFTALGAAGVAWGGLNDQKVTALAGLLLGLVMLFWGLANKEGGALIFSTVRKLMGSAGAVLVVMGVMTPEKSEALLAGVLPLLSMAFSFKSNGGKMNAGRFPVVLFLAVLALGMPACANFEPASRGPVSGLRYDRDGAEIVPVIDGETVGVWSGFIRRMRGGESAGEVLFPSK